MWYVLPSGALRVMLALLVMVSHFLRYQSGRTAVILFFVLSGYWVSDLWLRRERPNLAAFYSNRILRIWPLYIVILVATNAYFGRSPEFVNYALVGTASIATPATLGPEWSLDIELQFYLLLPAMHVAYDKVGLKVVAGVAASLSLLGWALFWSAGILTVFAYLPAFVAGMIVYRLKAHASDRTALCSLVIAGGITIMVWLSPLRAGLFNPAVITNSRDLVALWDSTALLIALPLIPYVVASLGKPSGKYDRLMGDFSFPLYLAHAPLLTILEPLGMSKVMLALSVLLLAVLVFLTIERPLELCRRALLVRKKRADVALPQISG